ncbi:MAG: GDSL-type esterase/lipase family protein [Propionibacteriaceae bacterium]|nr:GDSL-type esterase/lipase family protein [Propionibacteriaceae bacterium]
MFRQRSAVLAMLVALAVLLGAVPASQADQKHLGRTLHVVVLGDSFAAGNGAGRYYGPQGSFRSRNGWGHKYAEWLNSRGVATRLDVLAWSGHTAEQLISQQVPELDPQADLAMFIAGGNDGGFADVVIQCFVAGVRGPEGCRNAVEASRRYVREGKLAEQTVKVFTALDKRLAKKEAEIVLVGYPHLSLDLPNYVLSNCLERDPGTGQCTDSFDYPVATEVRALADEAAKVQQDVVKAWNRTKGKKVHFIGSIRSRFSQHEPDPREDRRNEYRWLNEFLETEGDVRSDGKTHPPRTGRGAHKVGQKEEWYHPNLIGQREIAAALAEEVGVPTVAGKKRSISGEERSDEIDPPDPHGVPKAWIQGPYVLAIGEEATLDARGSHGVTAPIVRYDWDLNGDMTFEVEDAGPILSHTWDQEYSGSVTVRVADAKGRTSFFSTSVDVSVDGDGIPATKDNCPEDDNHGQSDWDADGIGDACDPESGVPTKDIAGVFDNDRLNPSQPPAPPTPEPTVTPSVLPTVEPTEPEPSAPGSPQPTGTPSIVPSTVPLPPQPTSNWTMRPSMPPTTPAPPSSSPPVPAPTATGSGVPVPTPTPSSPGDPPPSPEPSVVKPPRPQPPMPRPGLPKTGS